MIAEDSVIYGDYETSTVWIGDKELDIRRSLKVENKSQNFAWGFHGSGPSQLALAILLEICDSETEAKRLYQDFKIKFIAEEPGDKDLVIPVGAVKDWVEERLSA